ncbi:hypothetical protein ONS95_012245 [Cadophora gregata]|uniref:uncharacterized protein n=1 Tax=Cadophora gregata TaxID=51156 RepID=UPI0026DCFCE2|nr:uncharacterized protein ONS95_012245 [Cadophora gregata]KAK0117933.1 hypothetical protein ONS95_012245 [Cadophora gregata]
MYHVLLKNNAGAILSGKGQGHDDALHLDQGLLRLAEIEDWNHVMAITHGGVRVNLPEASLGCEETASVGESPIAQRGIN